MILMRQNTRTLADGSSIEARVTSSYNEALTNPTVEVVYYNSETEQQYGSAIYNLRPGSALETLQDVEERVRGEVSRIEEEQKEALADLILLAPKNNISKPSQIIQTGKSLGTTRIICPYTKIQPATRDALKNYSVHYMEMDNGIDYWRLLKQLWETGKEVIIVEHDVIPWPGALEALVECEEEWCGYGYPTSINYVALGCCKLGAGLMKKTAGLWDKMLLRNWRNCDGHLGNSLAAMGIHPHEHSPAVINANPEYRQSEI